MCFVVFVNAIKIFYRKENLTYQQLLCRGMILPGFYNIKIIPTE